MIDLHVEPLHGDGERQQLPGGRRLPGPDRRRRFGPRVAAGVRLRGAGFTLLPLALLFVCGLGVGAVIRVRNAALPARHQPSRRLLSLRRLHCPLLLLTDRAAGAPVLPLGSHGGFLAGRAFDGVGVNVDEGVVVDALLPRHHQGVLGVADAHFPLRTLPLSDGLQKLEKKNTN